MSRIPWIFAIMAMAAGWEIIEWAVAVWDGGSDGLAFLGSQGDVWDAQKDRRKIGGVIDFCRRAKPFSAGEVEK